MAELMLHHGKGSDVRQRNHASSRKGTRGHDNLNGLVPALELGDGLRDLAVLCAKVLVSEQCSQDAYHDCRYQNNSLLHELASPSPPGRL